MSDPIAPPAARWPLEAAELVGLAMSDGDLGAAVAQYEPGAVLRDRVRHHVSYLPGGMSLAARDRGKTRALGESLGGGQAWPVSRSYRAVVSAAGGTPTCCLSSAVSSS